MSSVINILLSIIAVVLMIAILLQNRGSGVSGVFGGEGNVYRTKRGAEKVLFNTTIILSVLFFGVALYNALFIA
ncbi:MAG: preprotein translocase subunit SecG [Patescibacteria group bacterium]